MRHDRTVLGWLGFTVVSILLISLGVGSSFAQTARLEIPSSMNPVGSGARALGMGGAFIAVADDATAASWNPGGLIQLETPEVSIVGAYFKREENNTFGADPEASGTQEASKGNLNYFSFAYPFNAFNRNMVLSLNYQNLYDFTRNWDLPLLDVQDAEESTTVFDVELAQEGSLNAIGLAYSIQVTPRFSLGLTLNVWPVDMNGWEQKQKYSGGIVILDTPFSYTAEQISQYTFSGFNANIGILWGITSRMTLGAVLKTPFTADLKHKYTENVEYEGGLDSYSTTYEDDEELDMPMSYGIGLSYRFSDQWTAAIDIYRTEWDDFILRDAAGNETSPINNKPKGEAGIDPTMQLRTGFEYLYIADNFVVPVRGGVFYDPAPAEGSPDDYYGFSLGSGIAFRKVVFDMAYQFRFGNDVANHLIESYDFSQDMREHTLYASMIYHF